MVDGFAQTMVKVRHLFHAKRESHVSRVIFRSWQPNATIRAFPSRVAEGLGGGGSSSRPQRRPAAEILRARDVPLSVGAHPYGPCAQLHDGRRGGALQARQGLQRAASDGLGRVRPAGRERGACRTRSIRATGPTPTSTTMRGQLKIDGPVARLVARVRHLRPRLLQAPAEAVPRLPRSRPGRRASRPRSTGTRSTIRCSPTSR